MKKPRKLPLTLYVVMDEDPDGMQYFDAHSSIGDSEPGVVGIYALIKVVETRRITQIREGRKWKETR